VTVSALHEALVDLFRHRPALAAEAVQDLLHVELPAYSDISIEESALNQLVPVEFRADLVVLLQEGKPVAVLVVEVQLDVKATKRRPWASYVTTVSHKYDCDAYLLVVTPYAHVATWAADPIHLGGDSRIQPLVLGPAAIPQVTDQTTTRGREELAVLSALAHADGPDGEQVATAALRVLLDLDDERARLYLDVILLSVSQATRQHLEALMASGHYEFQSDFAKKYVALGRQEGREEGREEGRALAILGFLEARGFSVPEGLRTRVLTSRDHSQLDTWLRRAATCATLDEVFAE
jgi:hypothetical protein